MRVRKRIGNIRKPISDGFRSKILPSKESRRGKALCLARRFDAARRNFAKKYAGMGFRRSPILACLAAAAMTASLASCGKSTVWAAVIDGRELPAGVFISYQMNAYLDASNYIPEEEYDENGAMKNPDFNVLDIVVEDKLAREWINDSALKMMREFAAAENKFAEFGLSLPDGEAERAKLYVDQLWEYNPYAAYGLTGYDPYGVTYEKLGISRSSQIEIYLNESKKTEIFNYLYGESGVHAILADEIERYIRENAALIKYIEMPLKDGEGNLLKSDGKAQRLEMANDYVRRLEEGERFEALIDEFDVYYNGLIKEAERAAAEAAGLEWTDEDAAESGGGENGGEDEKKVVILKEGDSPNQGVVDKVFGGDMSVGDIAVIELDEFYYVVSLLDIMYEEEYITEIDMSVRRALRGDEYIELISTWTDGQSVVLNEAAFKRYTADTIRKRLG